jgi:hypothetical protein
MDYSLPVIKIAGSDIAKSPASRKHRRQIRSAEHDDLRMQAAVAFDPLAYAFRISRPQDPVAIRADSLIALGVPCAVEDQAGAWRDADMISRNEA